MDRPGQAFEREVRDFYLELDPDAHFQDVTANLRVPDRDTGRLRQVDLWVTLKLGGEVVIHLLVSCKDRSRPLDVGAIDTFSGEIRSSGAANGVLYSRRGFTAPAIEKARALGISCCRLFANSPPDRPSELLLEAYVAHPAYRLVVEPLSEHAPADVLWRDVFPTSENAGGGTTVTVREGIVVFCQMLFHHSRASAPSDPAAPGPRDAIVSLSFAMRPTCPPFRLLGAITWDWFCGKLDAFRLKGAVDLAKRQLHSVVTVGPVAMQSAPATATWQRCAPPNPISDRARVTITALAWPNLERVDRTMSATRIFRDGPWVFGSPPAELMDSVFASQLGMPMPMGMQMSADFRRGRGPGGPPQVD